MFRRILCATDFSDTAEAAWQAACELGRTLRSELVLVHVFTEFPIYPEVAVIEVTRMHRVSSYELLPRPSQLSAARSTCTRALLRILRSWRSM